MTARRLVLAGAPAFALALALPLASPGDAAAGMLGGARFPAGFRSWKVTNDSTNAEAKISQLYVPAVASLRLGSSADLVVSTAGASSKLDIAGGSPASDQSSSLSGASDVTAQLFWRLAGDRLLLQGGANLPSGKRELTAEEFAVTRALGHPLLGFGLKQYGQGFDVSGGASIALPLGASSTFGVGGGFIQHGSYTLLENGDDYKPAPEFSVSAGADFGGAADAGSGGGGTLRLDGTVRVYGKDELDGAEIFQEGQQIELQAQAQSAPSRLAAFALARLVLKGENTAFTGDGATLAEIKSKAGNDLLIQAGADVPIAGSLRGGVDGEWNRFSGSDTPGYDGSAFGVGPTLGIPVGDGGWLRLRALLLFGSIEASAGQQKSDLSGFAATFAFRWRAGS